MTLSAGTRLGVYEVTGAIAAGGMGEVYRARDTKLGRDVAIKLVLDAFAADRDGMARFEREARSLAALNHPNIATLHGMEEAGGRHFLVMELVDGPTLAELIAAGVPLDAALKMAIQIADALEAAHEKGVVHRDLKPANIKLTADDAVKVLDFGLAKAMDSAGSPEGLRYDGHSPTFTATHLHQGYGGQAGTMAGAILGTAAYMSPEQARGMAADHRSDIFSFGVVLYEMLSGRQPFQGETVSDVLASVLARDPDLASLPPDLAPRLSDLVRRCLEKHPKRRWQAIGDVRHELELIASHARIPPDSGSVTAAPKPLWRRALPIAVTGFAAAGIGVAAMTWARPASPPPPVSRFTVPYDEGEQRTSATRPALAISPDGLRIAYLANRQIRIREIGSFESRALPGAVLGGGVGTPTNIVFSPQGTAIAYNETPVGTIKQIAVAGGPPATVCSPSETSIGLSWYGDFIYLTSADGLQRCAVVGGQPEVVIKTPPDHATTRPQLLPDGRLLFSMSSKRSVTTLDRWREADVVVQRPGDAAPTVLFQGGNDPRYLASGHIVYVSEGILYGRTFDSRATAVGPAVPLVEGIFRSNGGGAGTWWYAVSDTGTLVYQPGPVGGSSTARIRISAYDRAGRAEALKIPAGPYTDPRVSPDGRMLAYNVYDGSDVSVWVFGMAGTESPRRLTIGGRDRFPTWSADSKRVFFQSDREGDLGLFVQPADGSGSAVRLTKAAKDAAHVPLSASPDDAVLLFDETRNNRTSVMAYSFKDKTSTPYGGIKSMLPTSAVFSPNGRWVAYAMRAEGQRLSASFVQPYPATGAKFQISANAEDAHHQVWSRDGKELLYTAGPGLSVILSVNTAGPTFSWGPAPAFPRNFANLPPSNERPFDTWKNAKGELVIVGLSPSSVDPSRPERIENRVVLNWVEELKARVK